LGAVLTLLRLIFSISAEELFKDDMAGECTKFTISPPISVEPWAYDLVDVQISSMRNVAKYNNKE
jgi:hypothetical protein